MNKSRNEIAMNQNRVIKIVLVTIIGAILCLCCGSEVLIRKAEQGPNVIQMREYLQGGYSFCVTPNGWAERIAMTRTINKHNKEQGNNSKEEMYTVYQLTDNDYWVTSERIQYLEFASETSDFYMCLGDMLSGIRQEKGIFYFCYMNEEQESELSFVLGTAALAEDDLNIEVIKEEGKEMTIVCVTVEPKSSRKGGI